MSGNAGSPSDRVSGQDSSQPITHGLWPERRVSRRLRSRSADVVGRVPAVRFGELVQASPNEVDTENIGQSNQIDHDIPELRLDPRRGVGIVHDGRRLFGRQPLELRYQFSHLTGRRHHKVLRIVKLAPVTLFGEGTHPLRQILDRRHGHIAQANRSRRLSRDRRVSGPSVALASGERGRPRGTRGTSSYEEHGTADWIRNLVILRVGRDLGCCHGAHGSGYVVSRCRVGIGGTPWTVTIAAEGFRFTSVNRFGSLFVSSPGSTRSARDRGRSRRFDDRFRPGFRCYARNCRGRARVPA
jgi:hypothetical protein